MVVWRLCLLIINVGRREKLFSGEEKAIGVFSVFVEVEGG